MSRRSLIRIAGSAGIGSAALALIALVGFFVVVGSKTISEGAESPAFYLPTGAALLSTVLLGVALIGLYLYQEAHLGTMGVVSFLIALTGTFLAAGAAWTYVFVVPYFAEPAPELIDESSGPVLAGFLLSYAVLALGWVLFGIATKKAGLLPNKGAIAMIVGAAIAILPMPSRTLILALAVAYLGNHMRESSGTQPPDPQGLRT